MKDKDVMVERNNISRFFSSYLIAEDKASRLGVAVDVES